MTQLRPYQHHCISATLEGWKNFRRQLVVAPTGAGKAVMMAKLAETMLPKRTLMLCHREELVDQAIDKTYRATGIVPSKEKAEFRASLQSEIVVGSVQTMQGTRLGRWPQDHFGLVIADEAHHAISNSWQNTLRHFEGHAFVWGCTATPDRGDKRNLGKYFENVAAEISLFDLIHDGFLSPIMVKSVPLPIDLSEVKQSAGDYDPGDLGHALEPYLGKIAEAIRDHASFRRVLVFVPLIATSHLFVEACNKAGLSAAHVDGNSPDRKEILADFAAGKFDVLSNAMLLTEGFDDPGIDCVVILRPTKSRPLYCQMVGRGTRVSPETGKENLLLLDFLWAHEKHNLIRPAHLVAKSDEEAQLVTQEIEERSAGRGDKQEEFELEGILSETAAKRHEALRKKLEQQSKKKGKLVDAVEWCLRMGNDDLADYEPTMAWESGSISEKQVKVLRRAGIDAATVRGRGHASKLISAILENTKITAATEAQKALMKRMGNPNWETATQDDARRFFAGLRT